MKTIEHSAVSFARPLADTRENRSVLQTNEQNFTIQFTRFGVQIDDFVFWVLIVYRVEWTREQSWFIG